MAYIGKSPDGTGVRSRFYYTQTSGGGTSVSGSSDDGTSLAFSDGAYVDVFLNGVLLVAGTDYNTSTANTIAGLAALANGDVVEVVVYDIFTVADTVSSLNGGTFAGNVNFSGNIDVDGTTTVDGLTSSEALDVTTSTHANASVFKSTGTTQLFLQDTDASSNDKFWGFQVSGGEFNILTCNDDRAGGFVTPVNISQAGLFGIGASSTGSTLHVQGNGARFVNSADTDALHLFGYNSNNNATISLYDNSGSHNVLIDGSSIPHLGLGSTSRMIGTEIVSIVGTNSVYGATIVNKSSYASGSTSVNGMYFLASNSNTAGYISWNGTSTSYNTSSDYRMKQGVEDMTGAITRVKQLAPKRFQFIDAADVTVDGFLAHEAQAVVPEAVSGTHDEVDDDGNAVMQGIDQSKLVPLLTAALKESIAKIETLETEMTALKARVTALEAGE